MDEYPDSFPVITSSAAIELVAFNLSEDNDPLGTHRATLDRLYKLESGKGEEVLTIIINDSDPNTMWYIAVPNDAPGAVSSSENRTLGADGANVTVLSRGGAVNRIYTGGQDAFLFVATLLRDVSADVEFFWGEWLRGDVNGDGNVDILDLTLLRLYLAGRPVTINERNADLDGSGNVDLRDVERLRLHLVGRA